MNTKRFLLPVCQSIFLLFPLVILLDVCGPQLMFKLTFDDVATCLAFMMCLLRPPMIYQVELSKNKLCFRNNITPEQDYKWCSVQWENNWPDVFEVAFTCSRGGSLPLIRFDDS